MLIIPLTIIVKDIQVKSILMILFWHYEQCGDRFSSDKTKNDNSNIAV